MDQTAEISLLQNKIDELNQLAWEIRVDDSPQSFKLSEQAISLAKKIGYKKGLAAGMQGLGFCHIRLSNFNEALPLIRDSLAMFEELDDLVGQSCGYEYTALIQRNWGDFGGAIKLLFKALELAESAGAKENVGTINYQLGVTYKYLGKFEKSLEYLDRSLNFYKEIGKETYGSYPINVIGSVYFENGDYPGALDYYKKSLLLRQDAKDKWGLAGSLDNVGITYFKLKNYQEAIDHCSRSLEISLSTEDKRSQGSALIHLAEIFKELGDIEKAINYSNESLTIREATGDKRGQTEVLLFLAELHGGHSTLAIEKAGDWLSTALKIAEEMKAKDLISKTRLKLYEFHKKQGRYEEAIDFLYSHVELEKELHKNTINQKVTNLEVSRKAEESRIETEQVRQRNKELTALNNEIAWQKKELEKNNRELEIEAALERVRSTSMAMHKSDDLYHVINAVSQQLTALGFKFDAVNFNTDYTEKGYNVWLASPGNDFPRQIYVPNLVANIFAGAQQELKEGKDFVTVLLDKKGKDTYFKNFFENTILSSVPEESRQAVYDRKGMATSIAIVKNIRFNVSNFDAVPYSDEENAIIKRFAAVFEQSYTRFLDLQHAELQAREALIEASLERVRSRAMAMQSSDELRILVGTVFSELTKLDLELTRCAIWIFDKKGGTLWWMSNSEDPSNPMRFYLPYHEHEPYLVFLNAWKNKEPRMVYELKDNTKKAWDVFLLDESELSNLPLIVKEGMKTPERVFLSASFNNFGALNVATLEPLSDEHFDILLRFARVFEMTYTRFHDLKQAEAQAREAQVEVGLERVRARTMAMHNSEDVSVASATMFTELERLGINHFRGGITHILPNKMQEVWSVSTTENGKIVKAIGLFDMLKHPFWREVLDGWEKNDEFRYYFLAGEDKQNYIRILNSDPAYLPQAIRDMPDCSIQVYFFGEGGIWSFSTLPHSEADKVIMKRFASVFSLTFRRYKDLQKAEGQARESQIQLALERVRARTMAMQKSEELADAAVVLFQQFAAIGETPDRISIGIVDEETDTTDVWATDQAGTQINIHFKARNSEHTTIKKIIEAWREGHKTKIVDLQGRDLQDWIQYLRNELGMSIDDSYFHGRRIHHVSFFSQGWLNITTLDPLPAETLDLLDRFAAVFNLTYTRFTDLKKAEAQAREAKIEAALERVRSRSMAMHHSNELQDVIKVIADQLWGLGLKFDTSGFAKIHPDKSWDLWISTSQQTYPSKIYVPYGDHRFFKVVDEVYEKGDDFMTLLFDKKEKDDFFNYFFENTEARNIPQARKEFVLNAKGYAFSLFALKNIWLNVANYEGIPFSEEDNALVRRFGKAFEQTYTRFLDLQKAENQARESQIEAALERVRSKAMAMHKSEDLNDAVGVVFDQLRILDLGVLRCGIGIMNKEKRTADVWVTTITDEGCIVQVTGDESFDIHPLLQGAFEAWVVQKDFSYLLKGDDLVRYYKSLGSTNFHLPESQLILTSRPDEYQQHYYVAMFEAGGLFAFHEQVCPDETKKVLKRFAGVFNLTYQRFLDIQKAEAQAREAQIEAALEKVRSRSLAMHQSAELREVITVVSEQLQQLQFRFHNANFVIIDKEKDARFWLASPGQAHPFFIEMPYLDNPMLNRPLEALKKGDDFSADVIEPKENHEFLLHMLEHSVLKDLPEEDKKFLLTPKSFARSQVLLKHIILTVGNYAGIPYTAEQNAVLKRFGHVFEQAYIRFLDLQKAEERANEARIETSLERVRAKAMSMHSSEDLSETINLFYHELGVLGIVPRRCGVSLIDKETKLAQISSMNTTESGETVVVGGSLLLEGHPVLNNAFKGWLKQEEFHPVLKGNEIRDYYKVVLPQVNFPEYPHDEIQYGDYFFFPEGAVFAWSTQESTEDDLEIYRRFTSVLSLTYRRYKELIDAEERARARLEDFKKLEEAKNKTEAALDELKATQSQLIQAEKMASLGELTAGIAHEIQNPLNFVNNFSEVNAELIEELNEQLAIGNVQEAKELTKDLKDNEAKINHHGKRADAIVKSMLQHSRVSGGKQELVDINALADEYLRLAYHGLRAKDNTFNAKLENEFDPNAGKLNVVPQDIGRVLINLINNAFYAVNEKKKNSKAGSNYEPLVRLVTKKHNSEVEVVISDNGNGIPRTSLEKIFQPFFTTKPTGQGTGLGLSLSYDIVKAHQGELKVETKEGEGSTFTIILPSE